MAYNNGPKIITNGLVMALDVANPKSFRGEPTTNFVPTPYDYSSYAYVSGPTNTSVVNENGSTTIAAKRYTITSAVNVARASIRPENLTTGTPYTFSVKWKYNGTNTASPGFALDASKGNPEGGTNNNTISSQTTETTSLGNGWYLSIYTFSFSAVPTTKCILTFGITTGADTSYVNQTFDVYEAQFEQKAYKTPYVIGTRGTTVAAGGGWADLAGNSNHGEFVNGPVYNSLNAGSLVFDGINDGVQLPGTNLSLNQMTISSWNFSTNYNQNGFMFEKTTNGTVNTQYSLFYSSGDNSIYYRTYGLSTTDLTINTTSAGVVNNQWNNVVATWDGGVKRIYVNGILRTTSAGLTGTVTQNTTGPAYIGIYGNFAGYPFNGRIAMTQVYNRALTATEVLQNFNATRSRYGV